MLFDERERNEDFGTDLMGRLWSIMWDFLEYPETSTISQVFHSSSMAFVFLSTVTFLIESSHEYEADEAGAVNLSTTTLVILKGRKLIILLILNLFVI